MYSQQPLSERERATVTYFLSTLPNTFNPHPDPLPLEGKPLDHWLRTGQMTTDYWKALEKETTPTAPLKPTDEILPVFKQDRFRLVSRLRMLEDDTQGKVLSRPVLMVLAMDDYPGLVDDLRLELVSAEGLENSDGRVTYQNRRVINWSSADYFARFGFQVTYDVSTDTLAISVGRSALVI